MRYQYVCSFLLLLLSLSLLMADTGSTMGSTDTRRRRERYSGKFPRKFSLKYKELSNNNTIIERVLKKGSTPAGMHVSIMVNETIIYMGLNNSSATGGYNIVDCTLGYGGHTLEMYKHCPNNSILYGIDQDQIELEKTSARINNHLSSSNNGRNITFQAIHDNFMNILNISSRLGLQGKVDCLLCDLGYSSMQIDNPERGFSYKANATLDMRMDVSKNKPAYELLRNMTVKRLAHILNEFSDEPYADTIAYGVLKHSNVPQTTFELGNRIKESITVNCQKKKLAVPTKQDIDKSITRTFQALRIEVNQEFKALDDILSALPHVLAPGGKAVFLTFHSGEDRRVKKSFQSNFRSNVYSQWSDEVVRASGPERAANSRSKCCKLRWCIKR